MDTNILKAVFDERKQAYHILTAIREAALAEPAVSKKFLQFITDAQQEAELNYLLISDEMHEIEESINETHRNKESGKDVLEWL